MSEITEVATNALVSLRGGTAAWDDIIRGLAMAIQDTRAFRGSLLGSFWLTPSTITMVATNGRDLCTAVSDGSLTFSDVSQGPAQ